MTGIEVLMEEHRVIERLADVMRNMAFEIVKGKEINHDDFTLVVDFIRNYSDGHHHKKEEIILFNRMIENLGALGEKTIKYGMLAEHDLARLYVNNLNAALNSLKEGNEEAKIDIIANSVAYAELLKRHANKEDNVIYKFALRELSKEIVEEVDKEIAEYEVENKETKEKYINVLETLEKKYM